MKIYFATTESVFFTRTSKLADFSYCLPKELAILGHDVRVVIPLYSWIKREYGSDLSFEKSFYLSNNGVNKYVGIYSYKLEGVTYYFIDNEYYFSRQSIDSFYDDSDRFGYFSRALIELLVELEFYPNIIHLNDWQTAMSATIFKDSYMQRKNFHNTKIVFTIHSLKNQGIFPRYVLKEVLSLNSSYFVYDKLEDNGKVNYIKGGINFSDIITTVSKTYANDIRHDKNVGSLQAVLVENAYKIVGIENGINYDIYDPSIDKYIFANYSIVNSDKRVENKLELQKLLGLRVDKDIPIISYVGDLVNDKGIDLIEFIFDEIMEEDIEFIMLGRGEERYENAFLHFSHKYRDRVSTNIFYSRPIAKKIYASSDIVLIPSRIEPCGMSQLIAMRYGSIPVVRKTGGLKDTVKEYDKKTARGTGFMFEQYNAHNLLFAVKDALYCYKDKKMWSSIIKQAMSRDSSWVKTAKEYEKIYDEIRRNNYE